MPDPTVCAIMLTCDRPELARRAVESFRSQTYRAKRLLILDSGTELDPDLEDESAEIHWVPAQREGFTIGELRNTANAFWTEYPILIHWDSDDFSHPNRIAEQVALLQSSGADVVGFREMLFWRQTRHKMDRNYCEGAAWLYSNPDPRYCLGSSLCYWRKTWERKPFEATSQGEDHNFCAGLKCAGVLSAPMLGSLRGLSNVRPVKTHEPRMIARIHAGNTSNAYTPEHLRAAEWRRVPEWDAYVRSVME
jgi:hypothetical protein